MGLAESVRAIGPGSYGIIAASGHGKSYAMRHVLATWQGGQRAALDYEYQLRWAGNRFGVQYWAPWDPRLLPLADWRGLPDGSALFIDEIDRRMARGGACWHWILDVVNCARPMGLTVYWTARVLSEVPSEVRKVARGWVVGRLEESDARAYLGTARLRPLIPRVLVMPARRFLVVGI